MSVQNSPEQHPASGRSQEAPTKRRGICAKCSMDPTDAMMAAELGGKVRRYSKEITGGNCAFADDDLNIIARLAINAVRAGLTSGISPAAAAKARARHFDGAERVHAQEDPQPVLTPKTDPEPSGGIK